MNNNTNTTPEKPTRKSLIKHFITKFQAIPEERWCVDTRTNDLGQHCVLGHAQADGEDRILGALFHESFPKGEEIIVDINNGRIFWSEASGNRAKVLPYFNLGSPKARVLAALEDKLREEL